MEYSEIHIFLRYLNYAHSTALVVAEKIISNFGNFDGLDYKYTETYFLKLTYSTTIATIYNNITSPRSITHLGYAMQTT